jgi:hypothetical protein
MTGRFQKDFLENLPEDEAVEMVFKYSQLEQAENLRNLGKSVFSMSSGFSSSSMLGFI